ncbi:SDR family NAD(P)-dependent oxidoreductase [Nocardia puris]|uniref:SDR family NAD(P)-dependent oxidoreductase n=1 Tax=Nocardia puris TaxID=208602 RepID=UPI001893733B|nr:SDR family NAD(P)-dependent oxidoreductase [Nocardia puris]MBF6209996.1 SDR family NAD(P)-dependent oxidoreductase [Nocardia puris]MBF6368187.1 SDR family NAD(P)-dependent oxidoreductase [Nocardia puris]MBF6458094.1 SDR family NAD(P)-dependent oxidoreductase [Nocardia puris]
MRITPGDTALITGASRGIGHHLALSLAARGVNVALAARSADRLDRVAAQIRDRHRVAVSTLPVDLNDRAQTTELVERAQSAAGPIDLLVNNAGVEASHRFDLRSFDDIATFTEVNLLAPMLLTRAVLPEMIARRRGHIVNMASIAGLLPAAYEEPYNATKFGLIGFTKSLRLTAQDREWGVSASAVCPGFTDGAGMYEDMRAEFGIRAPASMGSLPVGRVADAVVRAVEHDLPEAVVMRGTPRPAMAAAAVSPRLFERLARRLDLAAPFRLMADARADAQTPDH